jgi:hypothetical protein
MTPAGDRRSSSIVGGIFKMPCMQKPGYGTPYVEGQVWGISSALLLRPSPVDERHGFFVPLDFSCVRGLRDQFGFGHPAAQALVGPNSPNAQTSMQDAANFSSKGIQPQHVTGLLAGWLAGWLAYEYDSEFVCSIKDRRPGGPQPNAAQSFVDACSGCPWIGWITGYPIPG